MVNPMSDSVKFSKPLKFVNLTAQPAAPAPADTKFLQPIRAIVLLAGAVRPSPFAAAIGRALLDLPLSEGRTILDQWRWHALRLAGLLDVDRVPMRILVNDTVPAPSVAA